MEYHILLTILLVIILPYYYLQLLLFAIIKQKIVRKTKQKKILGHYQYKMEENKF